MAVAAASTGGEGGAVEGSGTGALLRIFVGGLAESVGAADLEAVFASAGRVAGVEFVRTNGRSFAYVDFHCPSDKALAKLFSTYNGCKWKGGKLRLEKAKEHYLTRLKREWEQEAAAAAQEAAVNDNVEKQDRPKLDKAALDGSKINLYFPKLRKVKALPFKGTGKHKYSFRHIEVPSYPIHFCDCEEHCGPPEAANNEYAAVLNAVVYEKERNIMNSVMNKLFEKENEHFDSSEMKRCDVHTDTIEPSDAVNNMQIEETDEAPEEDMQVEEVEESSDEDLDDDLVINIAPRKSNKPAGQANMKKQEVKNDPQLRKCPNIEEASLPKKRKRNEASSEPGKGKQEPISVILDTRTIGKPLTVKAEDSKSQLKSPGFTGKGTYELSSTLPRDESSADLQGVEAQTSSTKNESAQNVAANEPKKGSMWTQKSAWRDLVGGMGSTPFSISQVLPNTHPTPSVLPNVIENARSSEVLEATMQLPSELKLPSSVEMLSSGTTDGSPGGKCKDINKPQKVRVVPKITIGEVCPFMRNAESQKQWSKAKKAITGFSKSNESSGSKSNARKGKPLKKR
ncbi:hypothetical protein SEVIR_1G090900v4 [Setaria viridis]|uniref:RRM domain-containing protein n=1 Tax=Setaria viridis TaxID=4556 RepID=A0A4U6W6L4_SETVI|nr:uncharacterized protein LOC117864132 isoform X1 [Setaria viridis]TKW38091.1 hypothetical protein SEVIR_1G090900v2 [Setaria viridis]